MRSPQVSLVQPVYDPDPDYLRQALEGVIAQTLQDWELILIEEPGPRSAAKIVEALADARLRYVRNPVRRSLAGLRNQGLELATAEFVAMQDADDVSLPDRLTRQVAFLRDHPDITAVGARLELIDPTGRRLGYRRYPTDSAEILRTLPHYNPIAQPCVMFRREPVLEAGGYAEREDGICEDYELWSRLAQDGHQFANLPDVLLRYRVHPAGMKSRKLRGTLRDTLRIKRKYWRDQMTFGGRARMWGERLLLLLPPRIVVAMFLRRELHATPDG